MIYVHVPFCRSFCTYCGFYSEVLKKSCCNTGFSQALEAEILHREDEIKAVFTSKDVNTLYVGGGTPSLMPLDFYERLVSALVSCGHVGDFEEFTVEVNPEDVIEKGQSYIEGLLKLGVNRFSMGVQSFEDDILKFMNRRHSAAGAVQAYHILEDAGVENISIDLIFGLPQLSEDKWLATLGQALTISSSGKHPPHISAYQLSVETGSMLEKQLQKGMWSEASEEESSRQYDILCSVLAQAGYVHYEISNFAKPGYEAVHNSAYWRRVPYVGLGPGAHSYIKTGTPFGSRRWNEEDLNKYMDAARLGDFSGVCGKEVLTLEQQAMEEVMLGLRCAAGVRMEVMKQWCQPEELDVAFKNGCLVSLPDGRVRIPENRFFISDNIISSIL